MNHIQSTPKTIQEQCNRVFNECSAGDLYAYSDAPIDPTAQERHDIEQIAEKSDHPQSFLDNYKTSIMANKMILENRIKLYRQVRNQIPAPAAE